jgi:cardiolipin synthase
MDAALARRAVDLTPDERPIGGVIRPHAQVRAGRVARLPGMGQTPDGPRGDALSDPSVLTIAHVAVAGGVVYHVLTHHRRPGVALAWIFLAVLVPFLGALLYLMFGQRRLGRRWMRRAEELRPLFERWVQALPAAAVLDPSVLAPAAAAMARLARSASGVPVLSGNRLRLLSDSASILEGLTADVEAARESIQMEFYIWQGGGLVDGLLDALAAASRRGVRVRCAMDALGSAAFLRGPAPARLRAAGVEVVQMLPVSAWRAFFVRLDLRDHRKIAVIDDRVAWTGSMNVVDPRFFKQDAGVGEWVDAMVRIEGPVAWVLDAVSTAMIGLHMAAGTAPVSPPPPVEGSRPGAASVQVFPSGPSPAADRFEMVLLQAVYSARRYVFLSTPYFVPEPALQEAMCTAALRGVEVVIILPKKNDSRLVQYASAAHFDALLAAGVRILLFGGGLLHTKTSVVDGEGAIFGTANYDERSFLLNFEVSLLIYDSAFAGELAELCRAYERRSERLSAEAWRSRPGWRRIAENAADLAAPLL